MKRLASWQRGRENAPHRSSQRRPAMNHVAIDLGGRESQICMRSGDGRILQEERRSTLGLQKFLATLEPSKVVVETCAEAFMVAERARSVGHTSRSCLRA